MMLSRQRQLLVASAPIIFVLLWSTGYLSSRIIRPYVEPLSFSALRFAAASVIFIALVFARGGKWPTERSDWWHLIVCGVLIQGLFITGMMVAVTGGLDMGIAALVGGMQPVLTAFIAMIWLRERLNKRQLYGFVFGFIGLAMVIFQSINLGRVPVGALLMSLVAVLGITLGTIYQKKYVVSVDLLSGTAIQFLAACIPVSLLAVIFESGRITWNFPVVATAIWLIVAQSVGAVLILYAMIRAGAVSKVSSLFYLIPPICALEGFLLFGETLTTLQMFGVLVVTFSVLAIVRQD